MSKLGIDNKVNQSFCLFLIIVTFSCNKAFDFGYSHNKEVYLEGVRCLKTNYSKVFTYANDKPSISIYPKDAGGKFKCGELDTIFQQHTIEFVIFDDDSTVSFYSALQKGIMDKQYVLMFLNGKTDIYKKISSDMKILQKYGDNCYELERIVSLAN